MIYPEAYFIFFGLIGDFHLFITSILISVQVFNVRHLIFQILIMQCHLITFNFPLEFSSVENVHSINSMIFYVYIFLNVLFYPP